MQPNDPQIRWVPEPELGWTGKVYLPLFVEGIQTTLRHLVGPKLTVQSPEERHEIPEPLIYRGVHRLNRDEQGRVKCVACFLCATICPAHCIDIVAAPSPWPDRDKYPESFTIDELRCIYCGMCEEACPEQAIELTTLYDLTGKSREEMIFDKEKLLSVYDQTKDAERIAPFWQDQPIATRQGESASQPGHPSDISDPVENGPQWGTSRGSGTADRLSEEKRP